MILENVRPDVICTDLRMPGQSGFELVETLRSDVRFAHTPVIVVSVDADLARKLECQASAYLTKPIIAEELLATLRSSLQADIETILVVEDDADNRTLVATTLMEEGIEVRAASNGEEALRSLQQERPDAIVLDLMMPQMDGFELMAHLGANPAWARIPVVIMTAKLLTHEDIQRLRKAGRSVVVKGRSDAETMVASVLRALATTRPPGTPSTR